MVRFYKPSKIPSTADYIAGLAAIQPRMSRIQLQLLQEQYYAPNHTITATQLAKLVGIESGRGTVNLMYGRLGRWFCNATGFEPDEREIGKHRWWSVWSSGYEEQNPYQFFWKMHLEVVEALKSLGWVVTEASGLVGNTKLFDVVYDNIFNELVYEIDKRSPPDNRRKAQFKIGWENATLQRKNYTSQTLDKSLTWNNLGYRFGTKLGHQSNSEIDKIYDFLAHQYVVKGKELSSANTEENMFPDEVSSTNIFREGAVCQVSVNAYERNYQARKQCIAYYGTSCFVCNFNFAKVFGQLGKGFIHVHHLRPISEIAEEYEINPVKDLRPVCPNCHAMIHRRFPPLSLEEIKALLLDQVRIGK